MRATTVDVLRAAARTDPGRVRLNNEDLPLIDAARGIFGVIDGIGGQAGGEVAAATARDVILQRLARPLGTPAERVREAIAIANNEIHRRSEESSELRGMACVITLALVADGAITIGHVGDSRLYKLRPDGIRKLTRDHSPVGEREDAGELSEVDAMRHPRRHEVFRDVGSIHRDKDEQEFVDVVHDTLEADSALVICSDGLSDMIPASTIAHVVRQHAGDAEAVVDALVAAANAAGGRDNVTVVYAEMPRFAAAIGRAVAGPTEPPASAPAPAAAAQAVRPGKTRGFFRSVFASRTTWLALGTMLGVVIGLGLALWMDRTQVRQPQTFVVGAPGSAMRTIADALLVARAEDTVRVEPGVYSELVHVRDGVHLVARVKGTVTIARPAGAPPGTPTLLVTGDRPVRISGVRIESASDQPAASGIVVEAPATLELMEVRGAVQQAIDLASAASVTVLGSRFSVSGRLLTAGDESQVTLLNNVVSRTGAAAAARPATDFAIVVSAAGQIEMKGNVFQGYNPGVVGGVTDARRRDLLADNIVVPPPVRTR
jgi:serine/threonine protein phosphatase PrpC